MTGPVQGAPTIADRGQVLPLEALPEVDLREVQAILATRDPDSLQRAIERLRRAQGIQPAQLETLRLIATDRRYGSPEGARAAARMYVELLGAGSMVVLAEARNPNVSAQDARASRDAMDTLLRAAVGVWRGTDLKSAALSQMPREERLKQFVQLVYRNSGPNVRLREAVEAARASMQTRAALVDFNNLDFPTRPTLVRTQPGAPARGSSVAGAPRYTGANPRAFTVPAAGTARPLQRGPRPAGEQDRPFAPGAAAANPALRDAPPDKIPGTQTAWSPEAVAQFLSQTTNDERRIDVLHGLALPHRMAVAQAYARLRGQNLEGPQALAFLIQSMAGNGTGLHAQIYRDMLRPENVSGITSEHILIYSDATGGGWLSRLTGIGGANCEAIERILMFRSPEELRRIDAQMQETYGEGLEAVLGKVDTRRGKARLLFLYRMRQRGVSEIPPAELQAWQLRDALDDFHHGVGKDIRNNIAAFGTPQWNNVFRTLATLSQSELRAVAQAYHRQVTEMTGTAPQGSTGVDGNIADSALGRALIINGNAPMRLAGGDREHEMRMRVALQGLRFDPNDYVPRQSPGETIEAYRARVPSAIAEAEARHRQRVAQYIALTLSVADRSQLGTDDVQYALSLMRPPPGQGEAPQLNGRPYPAEVMAHWQSINNQPVNLDDPAVIRATAVRMLQAANKSTSGVFAQQNNYNLLVGEGVTGPAAIAVQLMATIGGPMGTLGGPYRQRTYQLLDMRGVPEGQRDQFMAQVRYAYAQINPGHQLEADVISQFGPSITLPGGGIMPSQAARLVQRGVISNAERVIYALYEPGLFGLVRSENAAEVTRIVAELTPLEKHVLRCEFQRLTGRDLRAELDNMPGREARMAAMAVRVFPHERDLLGAQAMIYLNAPTADPALMQQRAALGIDQNAINDFWSRNVADQAGLDTMRALVDQSGGAFQFSMRAIDGTADMNAAILAAERAAIGNPLMETIQSFLSHDAEGIRIRRRALEVWTRRAQAELEGPAHAVSADTQEGMRQVVRDLRERMRAAGVNMDRTSELVTNLVTTMALVGTMVAVPNIGPLWMSVIGGSAQLATKAALGQVDTVPQGLGEFIKGVAKGFSMQQAAAILSSVPVDTPIVVQGIVGASVGYNTAAINELARFATDPMLWRQDPAQAIANFQVNLANATSSGMLWGAGSAMLFGYIRQAIERRHVEQQPHQPGPSRGDLPPDRPVNPRPGGPGRPGGPDRPVDPQPPTGGPTRPTGPGNIGNTGGRPPHPGTSHGDDGGLSAPGNRLGGGVHVDVGRPGPIVHPGDRINPPVVAPGTNTGGTVQRPVTTPGRDVTPVVPGATGPTGPVVRPPGNNTGIGTGTGTGPRPSTRSIVVPGTTYQATVAADTNGEVMNVATLHWTAVAAAAVTQGGIDYDRGAAADALIAAARRIPIPMSEVELAMRTMTAPERRQAVREAAGAFAFTALAYMMSHDGALPESDPGPTGWNALLDLAWRDAHLDEAARARGVDPTTVSRQTKVTELAAFYYNGGTAVPTEPTANDPRRPRGPNGPTGPEPGPRSRQQTAPAAQVVTQLRAATEGRLTDVSQNWIGNNLQRYLQFRTGETLQPFPQGGVEYWAPRINALPNRRLDEQLREDAEALRAFGYRMPNDREVRNLRVTDELVAARDRAMQMAVLGGNPPGTAPATAPQLFQNLPRLRDFMVAATRVPIDQIPQLAARAPDALDQAVRAYKNTLRADAGSAALMRNVADDATITPAVLEAHARATGLSGPNALPQDPAQLRTDFGTAVQALRAASNEDFAAKLTAALRIHQRLIDLNALSQQERDAASRAIAEAVVGTQPQQRVARAGAFIQITQGQPAVAGEVWQHIQDIMTAPATPRGQRRYDELVPLALAIAGNVRDPSTPAPAGTLEVNLRTVSTRILASLDRLPVTEPAQQAALRRLREVTIARLIEERNGQALMTNELSFVIRHGSKELIGAVLAFAPTVPDGQALIIRSFINVANEGRSDRVGFVLQALFEREEPGFRDFSLELMRALWTKANIEQVQWSRRDNLAVAVAYNALVPGQKPNDPLSPIIAETANTEQGRAALRVMDAQVHNNGIEELPFAFLPGATNYEKPLSDRLRALLAQPLPRAVAPAQ